MGCCRYLLGKAASRFEGSLGKQFPTSLLLLCIFPCTHASFSRSEALPLPILSYTFSPTPVGSACNWKYSCHDHQMYHRCTPPTCPSLMTGGNFLQTDGYGRWVGGYQQQWSQQKPWALAAAPPQGMLTSASLLVDSSGADVALCTPNLLTNVSHYKRLLRKTEWKNTNVVLLYQVKRELSLSWFLCSLIIDGEQWVFPQRALMDPYLSKNSLRKMPECTATCGLELKKTFCAIWTWTESVSGNLAGNRLGLGAILGGSVAFGPWSFFSNQHCQDVCLLASHLLCTDIYKYIVSGNILNISCPFSMPGKLLM